jgi:hypothetical protein
VRPVDRSSVTDSLSMMSGPSAGGPPPGYYGGPPQDPWYGQPPAYGQQPADPYLGRDPQDPWAAPPSDPYGQGYYGGQDPYAAGPGGWYPQPPPPGWLPGPPPPPVAEKRGGSTGAVVVGAFLVLLGLWFLFRDQVGFDLGGIWPALAVALGALMVLVAFLPRRSR